MRVSLLSGMAAACVAVGMVSASYAAENAEQAFQAVSESLQKQGADAKDLNSVKASVVDMLDKGATASEVEKPLAELTRSGVKGKDFKQSVEEMDGLVKNGQTPREAGNAVSQAVHQAQSEGLKGKALAAKVHEAVRSMQAQKRSAQEAKKAQKQAQKQTQKQVQKQERKSSGDDPYWHGNAGPASGSRGHGASGMGNSGGHGRNK